MPTELFPTFPHPKYLCRCKILNVQIIPVSINVLKAYDYHHHISVMEMGHLLTRSGLTYPDVSSKLCRDSWYSFLLEVESTSGP
jgi:hypothetical protein